MIFGKKNWLLGILLFAVFLSSLLTGPADAQQFVPADSTAIQYFGRWDQSGAGRARTGRGAAYLRVDFTGTSLKLCLRDTQNWWRYSIDGREYTKFRPMTEETVLAENLAPGRHQLFLIRCTEGRYGISTLDGLKLDDGAELLAAAQPSPRRIEIVGDSIAAGANNDGPAGLSYRSKEDGSAAFAPELARQLGAEWSVVAKSGEGIVHNYGESWPGDGLHAEDTYARTFYTQAEPVWNPDRFPPQVILIALGTNDFTDAQRKPEEADFAAGYERLVRLIRKMNPEAVIIGVEPVPAVIGPKAGEWEQQTIQRLRAEGDQKLHYIPLNASGPLLQEADYAGDGTHPTAAGAKKLADYLHGPVAEIMGW